VVQRFHDAGAIAVAGGRRSGGGKRGCARRHDWRSNAARGGWLPATGRAPTRAPGGRRRPRGRSRPGGVDQRPASGRRWPRSTRRQVSAPRGGERSTWRAPWLRTHSEGVRV
jgi:hypothetical protein